MCARMKFNGRLASPGQIIEVASEGKEGQGKWAGFARVETLKETWEDKGWVPLDIPANEFAEHNRPASRVSGTQILTWSKIDKGKVISGVGNRKTGEVRIVTREASEDEFETFGHTRMPVLIEKRF